MKNAVALVCESLSEDLSGVSLKELELPEILPKQLLIKVKASSVNSKWTPSNSNNFSKYTSSDLLKIISGPLKVYSTFFIIPLTCSPRLYLSVGICSDLGKIN